MAELAAAKLKRSSTNNSSSNSPAPAQEAAPAGKVAITFTQ